MTLVPGLLAIFIAGHAPANPLARARGVLEAQCRTQAADPQNPWALAHGIVAFGQGFEASDGRLAEDVMVDDFASRRETPQGPRFSFPAFQDGRPVEPHWNLLAKTMVLAGTPRSRAFRAQGKKLTLGELEASVLGQLEFKPDERYWERAGWTLDLLAHRFRPGASTFVNDAGETVDVAQVEDAALTYLEGQQAFLGEAMDRGLPKVDKRKQLIYAHPCGGFHLIQGVMAWMRYPSALARYRARVQRQIAILFYRLGSETRVYDETLARAPAQYRLLLLSQKLKFYGHWLETIGLLMQNRVFTPSEDQRRQIALAEDDLAQTTRALEEERAFSRMDEFRKDQPQLALDLTGDACHAVHGLALVAKTAR